MTQELLRIEIRDAAGVFAARQIARDVAAELALERQDQVRVATALSEIGRELVVSGRAGVVAFLAADDDLVVTVEHDGPSPREALSAAARLMDEVKSTKQGVRMAKRRPRGGCPDLEQSRHRLASRLPVSALDELRRNNEDLLAALSDLQRQKQELLLLNAELEDTNRGVMALYSQLSDELEQTNRGVVALYAELDEKSEQLREASEARNRFWANVSHELRTPLNSIIGLARLLTRAGGEPLETEQRHQAELIESSGNTLLALVNDLLDVAKAESGRFEVDLTTVDVPALLTRLRMLLRPLTGDRPVSLTIDDAGAPATMLTDEVALTAILRNLLANGLKYTDTGAVQLSVQAGPGHVDFSVTDTGIGILADQQERVFEEFYQAPGVHRGGTGLGLPYSRRLAKLLDGSLTLTSEPGSGTTVILRLPDGLPRLGCVLVADDDAGYRLVLRGLLAGLADQIVDVADGEQALAVIDGGHVDLVLVDLRMPVVDGYALLERMPAGPPAIVVTSVDVSEPPPRANDLLRKDQLTRERLAHAIRRIVAVPGG
jgi:signal transduction histidine kinase/CheY-like chemotaxis protein